MAPALTYNPQEQHDSELEEVEEFEKGLTHRRRALTSVDNLATSMDDDDMGLQNHPNLAKDAQEMEQILGDLNSDLAQTDLLQAIKTLESGGDNLSTGDTDAIFPLSGFDLADTVDSESDTTEDKTKHTQSRLERRFAFLQRRLRILQARAIGKRISEEVAQTYDKSTKSARKDGCGRPIGLKAFLKRIETTAILQASAASRSVLGPKYYHAGTSRGDASRSGSIGIQSGTFTGLEETAGALRSHLSVVKNELDSDATASSSGAESNDEAVAYNNPHQQHMPIEKRALWTWQRARASIASRWCWLQAQVQELEYKIRQHNDLHKQVREAKGPVEFEGEPVAYEGLLPGAEIPDDDPAFENSCARHRPFKRETFKKRKLLQMHNLHLAINKAAKPSDVNCNCQQPMQSCPVCTGRLQPALPQPPHSTLSAPQRLALVDPAYHAVLSDIRDVSPSTHMSALTSRSWFRSRFHKSWRGAHAQPRGALAQPQATRHTPQPALPKPPKKPHSRLKRGRPPLSRRMKEREREEKVPTSSASGKESTGKVRRGGSTETRARASFDIDNIVIPQSVAANTRPQILHYKEIITPKWRVLDVPDVPLNNGVMNSSHRMSVDSEEEDVSESAVATRHRLAEAAERTRYLRPRQARRSLSHPVPPAHPAHPALPDPEPAPPAPPPPPPPAPTPGDTLAHEHDETVRPYTPRHFPLNEQTYSEMLSLMPEGYRLSSPEPSPSRIMADDDSSTLSPMSPLVFEGDDPDDAEWDPSNERERRKSVIR